MENSGPCGPGSVKKVSLEENSILVSLAGCEPDIILASVDTDTPTQTLLLPDHLRIVSLLADLYDRQEYLSNCFRFHTALIFKYVD